MSNRNLQQTPSGVWLFRRRVPQVLSEKYEGTYICMSLETHNVSEARIKRDAINTKINLEIEARKKSTVNDKSRFLDFFSEMREVFLKEKRKARQARQESDAENMFNNAFAPTDAGKENGKAYVEAFKSARSGEISEEFRLTISELKDEWLTANQNKKPKKYRNMVVTATKKLLEYLDTEEFPESISPGVAQKFIDALLDGGRSAGTVAHYKSKLAEVWSWGRAREKFQQNVNPWEVARIEATEEQREQKHFRNFSEEEAWTLLKETTLENVTTDTWPYPFATYSLIRMLPFLGCRLSELARAKREQVVDHEGDFVIEIWKGKTRNAVRVLPVCSHILPLLKDALSRSEGHDYLFPEIASEDDVNSISSRIAKITKSFEKKEGYITGIHSLRGQFATALEAIGCPEELAVILAGHKRLSLTYDLYSKHKNNGKLWPYIERLTEAEVLKPWVN
ncbi:tyrosine-type recombinase/integrase [Paraneptunicella aestuarii]|uniref:tyrosine-type recombinase/integrase n=1 Tax=Paraneptunicella aestuarii TaxID=2831148 RepID=UPI001E418B01|nr:tyrosine-type recombinase/integrase [Paraneptunicella aestuarii]UAA37840.1 tyrosine-type recombinase/integrase [Paraneptunicella aestuarii]